MDPKYAGASNRPHIVGIPIGPNLREIRRQRRLAELPLERT